MQGKGEPIPWAAFKALPTVFIGEKTFGSPPGKVAVVRLYVVASDRPGERAKGFVVRATPGSTPNDYEHRAEGRDDLLGWFDAFEPAIAYFLGGPALD